MSLNVQALIEHTYAIYTGQHSVRALGRVACGCWIAHVRSANFFDSAPQQRGVRGTPRRRTGRVPLSYPNLDCICLQIDYCIINVILFFWRWVRSDLRGVTYIFIINYITMKTIPSWHRLVSFGNRCMTNCSFNTDIKQCGIIFFKYKTSLIRLNSYLYLNSAGYNNIYFCLQWGTMPLLVKTNPFHFYPIQLI